jgi:hypothetical protein
MNQYPEKATKNQKNNELYRSRAVNKNLTTANLQKADGSSDN